MKKHLVFISTLVTVLSFMLGSPLVVTDVVAKEKVKIGGIVDITGPTNVTGAVYAQGLADYFQMINEKGGVNGRLIEYFPIDYQYKLPQSMAAYKRLVSQQKVIALATWGTGAAKVRLPLVDRDKIPQLEGGKAEDLVMPVRPFTFLATATYTDELKVLLKYISEHPVQKGRKLRIAIAHSDAEYGRAPIRKIEKDKVIEKLGMELVQKVIIPQSATEVVSQVLLLKKAKPDYILTVLSGKPSAVFLKDAYKAGIKSRITVFSVSGNYDLLRLAKDAARGVLMTTPFVFGNNADVPGIAEILNYYKKHHTDWKIVKYDYVSGWVNAMILTEAARKAGDNLTGDGMRIGLESLKDFQTGGLSNPVTFSSSQHRGSDRVKILKAEPNEMRFKALTGWVSP